MIDKGELNSPCKTKKATNTIFMAFCNQIHKKQQRGNYLKKYSKRLHPSEAAEYLPLSQTPEPPQST